MASEILQICFTLFAYHISTSTTPLLNILSESMMTTGTHIEHTLKTFLTELTIELTVRTK